MEEEVARLFAGKQVVFKRNDNIIRFTGKVAEVTKTSLLIEFRGELQYHSLDSIVQMEVLKS